MSKLAIITGADGGMGTEITRAESYRNIQSEKGIKYRTNRSIQVEGAFGVLKNDYGFQRFLLRGKKKVKLEILLLSMGYNLNKPHTKNKT